VEYDSAGNALAENLFGNRQISRQQGGAKSYLHIDASLNVRQLTDATGTISDSYSYDAFGNILTEAGTSNNPYRFAGERMGQVEGLTYLRARYYEPESGLFISRDPFAGVPEVPVTLHRYTYGFQNPVTYSDPSGELSLASVVTAVTIIGLVVGIGVNYLTDVKSTAKEFKGLTDQFRAKFCRGGLLGEGAAIADQTVLIAENEKDLRPSGPTSANYNVFAFGWGWGIGTFGSNSGGEEEFEAPGTRNITQFEGTGKLYTGGYSIGAGGYGAAGVAGEAHFLPEGSEIPITSTGQAGHAAGTAGAAAVSLTTFWTLQGKNNALGWNGALDCYRKPSK
jgi:RHS repeat-associated protein